MERSSSPTLSICGLHGTSEQERRMTTIASPVLLAIQRTGRHGSHLAIPPLVMRQATASRCASFGPWGCLLHRSAGCSAEPLEQFSSSGSAKRSSLPMMFRYLHAPPRRSFQRSARGVKGITPSPQRRLLSCQKCLFRWSRTFSVISWAMVTVQEVDGWPATHGTGLGLSRSSALLATTLHLTVAQATLAFGESVRLGVNWV